MQSTESIPVLVPHWENVLSDAVTCVTWSKDKWFTSDADGLVHVFTASGEQDVSWQAHDAGVIRICPQPDGDLLATAGEDGCIKLWKQDGTFIEELAREPGWIEHLEWSQDGDKLAAAAERTIYLWRGTESLGVWYDARRHVLAIAWAKDGKRLAMACNKGVYLWRIGVDEPVEVMQFPGAPISIEWKPDNKALAVGTQDGFLQIWRRDKSGKSSQLTMRGYTGKVNCLCWHPTLPRIATAGGKDVVIWDMSSAKRNKAVPLRKHPKTVTQLVYSPSAKWLASADRSGQLCLWDKTLAQPVELFLGSEVSCLAWSDDGRYLAAGNIQGQLKVYDINHLANA